MYPEMHQIGNYDTFILRRVCFLFLPPEIYIEYKSNRHSCWENPNPFHCAPTQTPQERNLAFCNQNIMKKNVCSYFFEVYTYSILDTLC